MAKYSIHIGDIQGDQPAPTKTIPDLRAALAAAEAELLQVAHAIGVVYEPDTGPCYPGPIEEIVKAIRDAKHGAQEGRARAEKAEAERDALRDRLAPSVEYVDGLACGYGDDEIDRLTGALDSERTRADRYLAAMGEYVDARADVVMLGRQRQALQALRAIVEEARRG